MLLKVAIDPYAGLELAEGERQPGRLLVRHLRERCLLVADSGHSLAELLEAFRSVRSAELTAVIEQLAHYRCNMPMADPQSALPTPIQDIERGEQVATWRDFADLLLLSNFRADELADRTGALESPEVATLRDAHSSEAFDRLEHSWAWTAKAGTSREEIWTRAFAPLAAQATHLFVIDGFLAKNLYDRLAKQGGRRAQKAGVEWFSDKLAGSRIRYVNVLCSTRALPYGYDQVRVQNKIMEWWSSEFDNKPRLDLRFVEGSFPHGRRLAFDGWAGYELHKGLATFDRSNAEETVALHASLALAEEVGLEYKRLA